MYQLETMPTFIKEEKKCPLPPSFSYVLSFIAECVFVPARADGHQINDDLF